MTTRPGTGLRRIAARLLPPATVERFVDPAVADLQYEYAAALAHPWHACAIRLAGTLRVLEAIVLLSGRYGLGRGRERLCRPYRPILAVTDAAVTTISVLTPIITISMVIAISMMAVRYGAHPGAELQISAFSLLSAFDAGSLQFGFTLALLTTGSRAPARRLKIATLLAMSVLFSAASVYVIDVTLSPGFLSRIALADHGFVQPGDPRSMLFAYGTRIAAGMSPLLFCVFALTLARRVRMTVALPAAASLWAAYLLWFTWLRPLLIASSLPVRLAVWAPDAGILLSTLLLAFAYTTRNRHEVFAR